MNRHHLTIAIAAIPAVMLIFSSGIQAVANSCDAMQLEPDNAAQRIRNVEILTGATVIAATVAGATVTKNAAPLATGVAVIAVFYIYDRIIFGG